MVKLRLARFGRRNRPFFRIVAVDSRGQRDGRTLENLGWYDPLQRDVQKKLKLDPDRYRYWRSVGAQPTQSLELLLQHVRHVVTDAPAAPPASAASGASTTPAPGKTRRAAKKKAKPSASKKAEAAAPTAKSTSKKK